MEYITVVYDKVTNRHYRLLGKIEYKEVRKWVDALIGVDHDIEMQVYKANCKEVQ